MMLPGSSAFRGALTVGTPLASSSTRSSRLVAARATKPSFALCLKATASGLVLNRRLPIGSKFTPRFIFKVGTSSVLFVISIVDKQLWTLTLNRDGPLGEEQV